MAEIMVWPNFFLMNIFFALKGSKLFTIISGRTVRTFFGGYMGTVETLNHLLLTG